MHCRHCRFVLTHRIGGFRAFRAPKSGCLKVDCSELVFKNVLVSAAGSTFLQTYENKMYQSKQVIKVHLANYIFDASSEQVPGGYFFLHLARQPRLSFENHKSQLGGTFGSARRNAQGRWGEMRGVWDIWRILL